MTVGGRAVKPLVKAAFGGRSALADMGASVFKSSLGHP
jgi:hypothetical protein